MVKNKVILLLGPAGSGKTSTADRIAKNKDWIHLSEDDFWVEIKKGRPPGEFRTVKEQKIVQPMAVKKILKILKKGKNVVFEFIIYENPPKPLIFYEKALLKHNVDVVVKVLRPTASAIMKRIKIRGRENDKQNKQIKEHVKNQVNCVKSKHIKKEWVVNNSKDSLEEVYKKHFKPLL
tara:strand:- start:73 stop:606 length:534 start_codon:yes stop_codon:yes gene_type:complete